MVGDNSGNRSYRFNCQKRRQLWQFNLNLYRNLPLFQSLELVPHVVQR